MSEPQSLPQKTPVLIVGSGSAGLSAALWLSRYNIPFTILERRSEPLQIGQADGVQCRTVEIFESFGISEELLRESYHVLEVAFWAPDARGGIYRENRNLDTERGLSHMPHVILNQARMNALMLGAMERGGGKGVRYGTEVMRVEVDEGGVGGGEKWPVRVVAMREGREEVWVAKYVLGCDGAHSSVRRSLGYKMEGDTTDVVWGVMDIYPRTNFPDIRRKCTIHSSAGKILIIPREGGSLVRFYIQLPPSSAKQIFHPYTMDFADTFWWSAYSIGQRLADHFHAHHRVFLTGDACHTHSPKAGQGMNVSLQDGYNIGWKLGMVLSGQAPPSLLETYILERKKVAKDLIDFDRELATLFSSKDASPREFSRYFIKAARYMAGLTARYEDSVITDLEGSCEGVAKGVVVGMRFPSAQVIRFCDCKAMQLLRGLQSDGRWRVIVFAGDIREENEKRRLDQLATFLESTAKRYTPLNADIDSIIEPILVLRTKFVETEQEQIPDYFWPVTGKWRIRDLHKVYIDDEHYNSGHGHAYEKYEVDAAPGAVVIVRPDQYVARVTKMDDLSGIGKFFEGFLVESGDSNRRSEKL
ncbi:putative phenol 2-monooxygenase [Clohesyomyces aquaticus]|uniref:Putative phenol 2-monooxygenase n=1 Tax=Clohesyomyces aquaticus TaxID=1231657 RepID=A0A1Y2A3J5_9PLEO|nr:putative phenol 2-monooxygenase [Clohesyomyces aquaticus]